MESFKNELTEIKKVDLEIFTSRLLKNSFDEMFDEVKKAINSGAIDIEQWDQNVNPMILPKIILVALLENEAERNYGKGTSFEKQIKKEVKNLKLFL